MITVQVAGLQLAINKLKAAGGPGTNKKIVSGMKKLGRILVPFVKQQTPYRSGTMQRAITHRVKNKPTKGLVFLLVGVLSKYQGAFEGKKTLPHRTGHLVTGKRKEFTQRIIMFRGKTLVMARTLVRGVQTSVTFRTNRGRLAYVLNRKVGAHKPNDIFRSAKTVLRSLGESYFARLLQ